MEFLCKQVIPNTVKTR